MGRPNKLQPLFCFVFFLRFALTQQAMICIVSTRQTITSFNIINYHSAAAGERYSPLLVLLRFAAIAAEVPPRANIIYNGSRRAGAVALTFVKGDVFPARRIEHSR